MPWIDQLISVIGAAGCLGAYIGLQRGWLAQSSRTYSLMNLIGSALLTYVAVVDRRIGFIIMEGAWVLASIPGALARTRST
ncbi:MAG: hypothetical protein JWM95_2856 [Gemmatimonadetes bacterium]|nr:hypothetical protein [Gemmatimonadota bacterium]